REQDQEDQQDHQRPHHRELLLGRQELAVFASPVHVVPEGQVHRRAQRLLAILDRMLQVAPLDAELHPDVALVVLAVDERWTVLLADGRQLADRDLAAVGRAHQQAADRHGELRYCGSMRTTRSNSFSPCTTCVAVSPPTPASTTASTSLAFTPYRASAARFTCTAMLGWPSSLTTVSSVKPGTRASASRIFSALACSTFRSGPKTFTASALFSPVSASSTASSAGWV